MSGVTMQTQVHVLFSGGRTTHLGVIVLAILAVVAGLLVHPSASRAHSDSVRGTGLVPASGTQPSGGVLAWGRNGYGQTDVPTQAQSGITAIAAGWRPFPGVDRRRPRPRLGVQQLRPDPRAGPGTVRDHRDRRRYGHSLALTGDGRVLAWGCNGYGQTNVPAKAQSGITAIAAGGHHSLALTGDGQVLAWGYNGDYGLTDVPAQAQSGITAIAAGWRPFPGIDRATAASSPGGTTATARPTCRPRHSPASPPSPPGTTIPWH